MLQLKFRTVRYRLLFIVLTGFIIEALPVQGRFATKKLASLARTTGFVSNDSINSDDIDTCYYFRNHPVHVKFNCDGDVSHLGYSLFCREMRKQHPSVVYDFLERYLLELDLLPNDIERRQKSRLDKVLMEGDPIRLLAAKNQNEKISINTEINHGYVVRWERGDNVLSMKINADYQLILGADELELEEIFSNKLKKKSSERNGEGDIDLIYDRYGYVKDTIRFFRQDIISLIEQECNEVSFRPKTTTEDVMFAINRDLGFVHLASFKPDQVRVYTYIPIYDASEKFINKLVPQKFSDKYIEPNENDSTVLTEDKENYMIIKELLRHTQNAIKEE